jgi:glutathione synthase/RimK-type ligase-like ATP-grasp enzyme
VSAALTARGAGIELFDPTAFPGIASLSLALDEAHVDEAHDSAREPTGATAIWSRLAVGVRLPPMEPGVRETCVAAAEMLVVGWLETTGAFQLDPHWVRQRADNKPHQLALARASGLDVPATLVSNDPEAVRAFAAEHGPLVAKVLVQPIVDGGAEETDVVFTTALGDQELADLSGLYLCPMIFQERVPNAGDVRATVVGSRVIAAVHHAEPGEADWRRGGYARDEAPVWAEYRLPDDVEMRLRKLTERLGLGYAAADLVRRPDGTHAFLEVNASGSFGFLGEPIATRIAEAVADALLDGAGRRRMRRDRGGVA